MNRTSVLILQNRRERLHRFNTARIVARALERCQLIVGHTPEFSQRFDTIPFGKNVGLLYPGDDARLLSELPQHEHPEQLVIPDGTWHHVKTLMRDVPQLQTLPRYRLAPVTPSAYRIRREPHAHGLSTLEATVAALKALEPETDGLDDLLSVFNRMVTDQVEHSTSNWRQNKRRRTGMPNVPRILTGDLSNIVVAYGEQERGYRNDSSGMCDRQPALIYWTAVRLVSGERFTCMIESESLHDPAFLKLLGLTERETQSAVSLAVFRESWKTFLRPHDRVAVYHHSTAKLIQTVDAQASTPLILKSIRLNSDDTTPNSAQSKDQSEGLAAASLASETSRASQRLANAVAFVESLSRRFVATD